MKMLSCGEGRLMEMDPSGEGRQMLRSGGSRLKKFVVCVLRRRPPTFVFLFVPMFAYVSEDQPLRRKKKKDACCGQTAFACVLCPWRRSGLGSVFSWLPASGRVLPGRRRKRKNPGRGRRVVCLSWLAAEGFIASPRREGNTPRSRIPLKACTFFFFFFQHKTVE